MPRKQLEPVRCICGRKGIVFGHAHGKPWFGVECRADCWTGPVRTTRLAAVKSWNSLMQLHRMHEAEWAAFCKRRGIK